MTRQQPQVAAIGEVMVELAPAPPRDDRKACYSLSFAGDTFNTAVGLSRLGVSVAYVTRLGDDHFSRMMLHAMEQEGIHTHLVECVPQRQPGLYMIANDEDGERHFSYWRGESPARELLGTDQAVEALEGALKDCRCLYLSGITLAIMTLDARTRLKMVLARHRARGGIVVFDPNYRPRLWRSPAEAKGVMEDFLAIGDIALVTLEDELALQGGASVMSIVDDYRNLGVAELVIKCGADPVIVCHPAGFEEIAVPPVEEVVDTTGAGDAFNAGYLSARMRGAEPAEAVREGNRVAGVVIRARGGIVERPWFLAELGIPVN